MWTRILSWLISSSTTGISVICLAGGFFCGGYLAHQHYTNEILQLTRASQEAQLKLEKARNDALGALAKKQLETNDWRVASDKRISDLTHRVQLAESNRRRAEQAARRVVTAGEERCRALLARGTEVVRGCSAVLGNAVVRCDSLIEFHK